LGFRYESHDLLRVQSLPQTQVWWDLQELPPGATSPPTKGLWQRFSYGQCDAGTENLVVVKQPRKEGFRKEKDKLLIVVWLHIWILYSVPLVFMSVFVPVPCCFYCYCFVI
jgi:hypothetical protein